MTQQWPRRAVGLGLLAAALGLAAAASQAAEPKTYPDQMIRLVVPFTAGGPTCA